MRPSAGCVPRILHAPTSMVPVPARRHRRCRSMLHRAAWKIWRQSSAHDKRVAAGRRHRARHRADSRLGHLVLFPRSACGADRRRHRLVIGLGRRRRIDRIADRRVDRAAGRRHHRPTRRPAGAGGKLAALCRRSCRHRPGAILAGLSAGLGCARWRHGHRTL